MGGKKKSLPFGPGVKKGEMAKFIPILIIHDPWEGGDPFGSEEKGISYNIQVRDCI